MLFVYLCLLSCLPLILAASPPRDIVLVYPTSQVNVGQNVTLGYQDPSSLTETFYGLAKNLSISVTWPNGTTNLLVRFFYPIEACTVSPSSGTGSGGFTANQTGQYTAIWEYSYAVSSDPSQANATYCGPPPISFQHWSVNRTFEAVDLGPNVVAIPTTVSTELPTEPTGAINTSGGMLLSRNGFAWCFGILSVLLLI